MSFKLEAEKFDPYTVVRSILHGGIEIHLIGSSMGSFTSSNNSRAQIIGALQLSPLKIN